MAFLLFFYTDVFKISALAAGTAYTSIKSEYSGILTDVTYFVPLGKEYKYWLTFSIHSIF